MLRIGFDARLGSWGIAGGTVRYTKALLAGLRGADDVNKYMLLTTRSRHSRRQPIERSDGRFTSVEIPVGDRLARITWLLTGKPAVERFAGPLDILHSPTHDYVPTTKAAARVVTIHDLTFLTHPQFFPRKDRLMHSVSLRKSIKAADLIIANSEYTSRSLQQVLQVPSSRIRVVHMGVKPVTRAPGGGGTAGRQHPRESAPYMLFVGTIEPRKNLERLLVAFEDAKSIARLKHRLVVVGRPGWLCRDVLAELGRLQRQGVVCYLGPVPDGDLAALIAGATALLYPSLEEGFGLPPLEAMAHGVPTLVSRVGALPEVVGDAAVMATPTDVVEIRDAIVTLASDDALRRDLQVRGLARSAGFTWDRTVRATLGVYSELAR